MHHHYEDIRNRIKEAPVWFDEHGVPRYDPFLPTGAADIYADEVALVEIACQNCGTRFMVVFSENAFDRFTEKTVALADAVRSRWLHYGDPPNTGCCAVGPTMNCEDLRVVEYWRRSKGVFNFERVPELEIRLDEAPEPTAECERPAGH